MNTAQAAATLSREGALQRHFLEREPILERARQMNAEAGRAPDPRLYPVLVLTQADKL